MNACEVSTVLDDDVYYLILGELLVSGPVFEQELLMELVLDIGQ